MKTRFLLWLAAGVAVVVVLTICLFLFSQSESGPIGASQDKSLPPSTRAAVASTPAATPLPQSKSESQSALVKQGFEAIFEGMKNAGAKEGPPIAKQLRDAVESRDHAAITRAFHEAIYDPFAKMGEAIPAIKEFLSHEDPFVRYSAAQALCRAGDRTGIPILIEMVEAKDSIPEGKQDLRVQAALLLAKFREYDASRNIVDLYSKTKNGELLTALATLRVRAPQESEFAFVASSLAVSEYGKIGANEFIPQLRATFEGASDTKLKNASAWTLAQLTGEQRYVSYLAQAARPSIEATPKNGELKFDDSAQSLRYVGSLQNPLAKQTLERALDSNNPVAVQYAVVNLLFNQPGGSEKAKEVVLRELRGEQRKLGTELMFHIAAKLDDPEVRVAGEMFDQRTGEKAWRYYAVERRQWPIYNWIDDYVVTLN